MSKAITGFLQHKAAETLGPTTLDSYERILKQWLDHIGAGVTMEHEIAFGLSSARDIGKINGVISTPFSVSVQAKNLPKSSSPTLPMKPDEMPNRASPTARRFFESRRIDQRDAGLEWDKIGEQFAHANNVSHAACFPSTQSSSIMTFKYLPCEASIA